MTVITNTAVNDRKFPVLKNQAGNPCIQSTMGTRYDPVVGEGITVRSAYRPPSNDLLQEVHVGDFIGTVDRISGDTIIVNSYYVYQISGDYAYATPAKM